LGILPSLAVKIGEAAENNTAAPFLKLHREEQKDVDKENNKNNTEKENKGKSMFSFKFEGGDKE